MQKVTLQLVEVVNILLFCINAELLKKERQLLEAYPVFKKLVKDLVVTNSILGYLTVVSRKAKKG